MTFPHVSPLWYLSIPDLAVRRRGCKPLISIFNASDSYLDSSAESDLTISPQTSLLVPFKDICEEGLQENSSLTSFFKYKKLIISLSEISFPIVSNSKTGNVVVHQIFCKKSKRFFFKWKSYLQAIFYIFIVIWIQWSCFWQWRPSYWIKHQLWSIYWTNEPWWY